MDYKGLTALSSVIELQSFEKAANKLNISQSAVSQRIALLEKHYGVPLMLRYLPYQPTALGEKLLNHWTKVKWLESALTQEIETHRQALKLSIAINYDSLDTWFSEVLIKVAKAYPNVRWQMIADDQELTANYIKEGKALACVSNKTVNYPFCQSVLLGSMDYLLVASVDFYQRYFAEHQVGSRSWLHALKSAPFLTFNQKDDLNIEVIEKFYHFEPDVNNMHIAPSVKSFKSLCLEALGYALIPKADIVTELTEGKLVVLDTQSVWRMPLYWHYWDLPDAAYRKMNNMIVDHAQAVLTKISSTQFGLKRE
ncbi:ArgP/LysG family DNA-binding transcriptional regulator [Cysteiniphilum sp. JM-1]|uniref:ArgP/LysG family DNA-binding transcriptional regulator n=1 Tax=Cysteiniphilum sp. JM-1 TaxID=2610891 RepID=UPI001248141D|nr:ArgP/LysG family DNA-binding transcriptional regulator [Cysteiniphilum sp. JM-1]